MKANTLPQISGQLEYLEKNLGLLKVVVRELAETQKRPQKTLFGSLPKTDLTLTDFTKLRQDLSSSWEKKWFT